MDAATAINPEPTDTVFPIIPDPIMDKLEFPNIRDVREILLPNEAFEFEETVNPIRHIEDIDTGPLKHDTCLTLKPDFVDNGPVTICSFPTYIFP